MPKVQVFPTRENAKNITHPLDGVLRDTGSMWESDGFTGRMLADNVITLVRDAGHKFAHQTDHTKPPARATGSGVPKKEEPEQEKQTITSGDVGKVDDVLFDKPSSTLKK